VNRGLQDVSWDIASLVRPEVVADAMQVETLGCPARQIGQDSMTFSERVESVTQLATH
jgi:hypothetical protein